jgi:hypothetical protein
MAKFLDYYADFQSLCSKHRRDRMADGFGWIRHQDIFSAAWQMVGKSQEGGPPIERTPPCVIGEDTFAGAELLFLCDVHATWLVPRRRGPEGVLGEVPGERTGKVAGPFGRVPQTVVHCIAQHQIPDHGPKMMIALPSVASVLGEIRVERDSVAVTVEKPDRETCGQGVIETLRSGANGRPLRLRQGRRCHRLGEFGPWHCEAVSSLQRAEKYAGDAWQDLGRVEESHQSIARRVSASRLG